ncbi:hypothetical protein ACFQXA_22850 [Nocardiopsis composta]
MNGEETGTGADVLLTCPACEDVIGSEDEYCENCGHRLGEDPPEPEPGPEHEPAERDRIETALGPIAGVTDRGLRHERNEDAMAMLTPGSRSPAMIGVVCDGVSSSPRPDDASLVAAETGAAAVAEALRGGADHRDAAAAGLTRAAAAVAALAGPDGAPACTYVSASMPEGGGPVTIGWIGDSRAYWLPGPGAPGPPAGSPGTTRGAPPWWRPACSPPGRQRSRSTRTPSPPGSAPTPARWTGTSSPSNRTAPGPS